MAFSGAAHTPLAAPENESEPPLEIIFLGAAHLLQYRSLFVETGDFLVRHKKKIKMLLQIIFVVVAPTTWLLVGSSASIEGEPEAEQQQAW